MKKQKLSSVPFEPSETDVQKSAYLLWKEEGSPAGRDLDFWLKAKELIRHRAHIPQLTLPRGRHGV
jgi:hypothetical protein